MLFRKMWRDLLSNKVQFMSIFLMSLLGIYVFVGLDSECNGMRTSEKAFYEECDLADLFIQGKLFVEDDVKTVKKIPGIVKAEKRYKTDGKAELDVERDLQMYFLDSNEISRLYMVEGTPYVPGMKGVWTDYLFAKARGLEIGDKLKMKVDGTEFEQEIMGTVYSPEHVYFLPDAAAVMPDYGSYGVAFMDASSYPKSDSMVYNQIIADLEGVDNTGGLSDEEKNICKNVGNTVKARLDSSELVSTDKDSDISYQTFRSEIEQHSSMVYIFPMVFLLIAMLGIITTMTRMTSRQRMQIGTLKALGFTKKTIIRHYCSYSLFLSILGGIIGAVAGYYTIGAYILSMLMETYLVPGMGLVFSARSFIAILVSALISVLVSYLACRKELAPAPAETLRPESPKDVSHTAIENSSLWMKLDFATQWNLRDIMRNKVRSLMGVFGVLGCSMLLFGAFGCLDTVKFMTRWMYGELNTASYQIIMEQGTPLAVTEEYAKKYRGQMVENAAVEFEAGGIKKSGSATIYDKGGYLHFQDKNLKEIQLNTAGISMSYKMADILGLKAGDTFRWHVVGDDRWHISRISGIYRNPTMQGITMTREVFRDLEYDFVPDTIYTNRNIKDEFEDDDNVVGAQSVSELMDAFDAMKEMMYAMVYMLIGAAAVLGIVVLYNLGVLSLVEKHREMATLKVLGFTTGKIRRILQDQNIWLTTLGLIGGIPAGMWLIAMLFASMPEAMDYIPKYEAASYLYTVVGTFALSVAVNRFLSRKVKTVDMVDALKGVE